MHNMQLKCQLGWNSDETQEHILDCNFFTQNKSRDQNINYLHIYGYPEQQIKVTQIFSLTLEEREELIIQRGAYQWDHWTQMFQYLYCNVTVEEIYI